MDVDGILNSFFSLGDFAWHKQDSSIIFSSLLSVLNFPPARAIYKKAAELLETAEVRLKEFEQGRDLRGTEMDTSNLKYIVCKVFDGKLSDYSEIQ